MLRTKSFTAVFSLVLFSSFLNTAQANLNEPMNNQAGKDQAPQIAANTSGQVANSGQGAQSQLGRADRVGNESVLEPPLPIARALEQGMTLESRFKAASGLTGWVLSLDGRFTLVYTTADQRTLISGALIDEAGNNLSEWYAQQYFPKPEIALLKESTYISVGAPKEHSLPDSASAAASDTLTGTDVLTETDTDPTEVSAPGLVETHRVIYAFFDPSCPFCHLAWKAFQPYLEQGVEIRWIPVAFLNPQSRDRAAAILQNQNPETALEEGMRLFGTEDQPSAPVKDSTRRQLQNNMKLMQRFGIQGTPGMVWLDETGELNIRSGMPRLEEFAQITGLPEQPQTDPELFRFR